MSVRNQQGTEKDDAREAMILAVTHGFHDFTGGHPDYPNYDEVACGGSPEYHCEAGHEHGSRGVCWACEPPSAHIVDTVLLPLLAQAWELGYLASRDHKGRPNPYLSTPPGEGQP